MAPLHSCAAAIVVAVAAMSSALSNPGSDGTSSRGTGGSYGDGRLAGVDDEALAEHGVERLLRGAGQPRPLHDVPHQQPVVELRRDTFATERAVEPPVGRVQRVGVVG